MDKMISANKSNENNYSFTGEELKNIPQKAIQEASLKIRELLNTLSASDHGPQDKYKGDKVILGDDSIQVKKDNGEIQEATLYSNMIELSSSRKEGNNQRIQSIIVNFDDKNTNQANKIRCTNRLISQNNISN